MLGTLAASLYSPALKAEDPPPLPPNPFSNLPANNDQSFSPFDDDFEDRAADEGGVSPPPSPSGPGSAPPRPSFGQRPGASGRPGSLGVSESPQNTSSRMEPANNKDIVENFDYPDAEILDVAKAISKLTGKNFIYNPQDVKGRISVVSQTPITVGDAWNAFLTALNMRGFALIPSGRYFRIERLATAKEKQTPLFSDRSPPNNDEFITRVIPLRFIDAAEFEQAFRLWMPREARMQAYQQTNTVIITDTAANISRMMELIKLLDVVGFQESLVVVPLRNAPAKEIARLIEQILSEGRTSGGSQFGAPPRPQIPTQSGGRTRTGRSGGSVISKIIADDRTNSLIVKANAAGIGEIRTLVRRLDQKVAPSEGSGRIHVIQLQFAEAETLAKTLSSITSSAAGGQNRQNRAFPGFGEGAVFQGDIRVAADKTTQSLVVTASPQDFATLKRVVETLDVPRDQVFIEAMILEMRLGRNNNFGTSFISAPNGVGLDAASGNLLNLLAGNPISGGFALGFKSGAARTRSFGTGSNKTDVSVNSLNGLVELIQGNSDANVIATPQIIALDNEKATFTISEKIKVEKSSVSATGQVTRGFDDDTADIQLIVTPQINKASNFVKLDIDQKIENFDASNVPEQLRGLTQGKNSRATNTKLIVQNEDTVVISGMIRDSKEETVNKVPILGDIPILGWLFKNSKTVNRKSNLLVFITPTIVKRYDTMRRILDNRLGEREDFIQENYGSKDPHSKRISRMRKSLPDLTVIEPLPQKRPQESTSIPSPSGPDRDYEDEFYDPNANYYGPEGGAMPLNPMDPNTPLFDGQPPGGPVEMNPVAPVLPEDPNVVR
jgi:general secretion pathway protein D